MKIMLKDGGKPPLITPGNAGCDLYYNGEDISIAPGQRVTLSTGLYLEIPSDLVGLIWPRSGLSVKQGIDVLAGVVDPSYRGEIKVCLLNTSSTHVEIKNGERIAQMIFQPFWVPTIEIVDDICYNTERGENGFGSSGRC